MATSEPAKETKKTTVKHTESTPKSKQPAPSKKSSNKSLWIILSVVAGVFLLGFIGILVAGWLLISGATKDITKTSDAVVVAVINNSPDDIFAVASSTFKDATKEEDVVSTLDRISSVLADGTYKVTNTKVSNTSSGETAAVDYKITTPDGKYYMRVNLEKEGDSWAMLNFQTSQQPIESSNSSDSE